MFEAAEPIITRLGGKVVGKEFTKGDETDFAPLIARIAATKAKVLLLFALERRMAWISSGRRMTAGC